MKQSFHIIVLSLAFFVAKVSLAQSGTIQVFTSKDAQIFIDGQFAGTYGGLKTGYYFPGIPAGNHEVKCVKDGYHTRKITVGVVENQTSTVELKLKKVRFYEDKTLGIELMGGTMGTFKTPTSTIKSDYFFGVNPYMEKLIYFKRVFMSYGAECMINWAHLRDENNLRMMVHPNLRTNIDFFGLMMHLRLELAGGFSWWPVNKGASDISTAFNENRFGWNARSSVGYGFYITRKSMVNFQLGYFSSSTTHQTDSWIRFGTPYLSTGIWVGL